MTIQDLVATFKAEINKDSSKGQVTFNRNNLISSGATNIDDIITHLTNYLGLDPDIPIIISGISEADISLDNLILIIDKGSTSFLATDMLVEKITFSLSADGKVLDLLMHTKPNLTAWQLDTSFPTLIVFPELNGYLKNPNFIFTTLYSESLFPNHTLSYHINGNEVKLTQFLNLYADIDFGGSKPNAPALSHALTFLTQFAHDIITSTPFFFGKVDVYKTKGDYMKFPDLNLVANLTTNSNSFEIFKHDSKNFLTVANPRLVIDVVDVGIDEYGIQDFFPSLYFYLDLLIEDEPNQIRLDFFSLLGTNFQSLMMVVEDKNNSATLQNVIDLMAGNNCNVPDLFKEFLDEIEFKRFIATMFIDRSTSKFRISSLEATFGSNPNKAISLFGPFQNLGFDVVWTILDPFDKEKINLVNFTSKIAIPAINGVISMEIFPQ